MAIGPLTMVAAGEDWAAAEAAPTSSAAHSGSGNEFADINAMMCGTPVWLRRFTPRTSHVSPLPCFL